jgi:hypothetical protein
MSSASLDEIEQEASSAIPLTDVPNEVDGSIVSAEVREDNRKNKCLFVKVAMNGDEEQTFTQKYTPTIIAEFTGSLRSLGFSSVPKGTMLHWKKDKRGRVQFDRWYPVKVVERRGRRSK